MHAETRALQTCAPPLSATSYDAVAESGRKLIDGSGTRERDHWGREPRRNAAAASKMYKLQTLSPKGERATVAAGSGRKPYRLLPTAYCPLPTALPPRSCTKAMRRGSCQSTAPISFSATLPSVSII